MNLTFVVSTGRAGSTLLSQILHEHPEVLSVSEFYTVLKGSLHRRPYPGKDMDGAELWRILSAPDALSDAVVRQGLNGPEMLYPYDHGRFRHATGIPAICHSTLPMLTDDPDALFDELAAEVPRWPVRPAADQYRAFFAYLAGRLSRSVVVERSGGTLFALPVLHREFPEARFLHMFRDGPDCALSMSRLPLFQVGAAAYHAAEAAGLPPTVWLDELQEALPELYAGLLSPPYDLSRLPEVHPGTAFFGEWWSTQIRSGVPHLCELPGDQWDTLRYEDLLRDPEAELTRLASFLGVEAIPQWLSTARRMVDPGRAGKSARVDPETLARLQEECEPGVTALETQAAARTAGTASRAKLAPRR
jgi:Sulfotransferase family